MLKLIIGVAVGAALGAYIGASRSCETGACPLTSNPYLGGAYGALMGFLMVSMFSAPAPVKPIANEENVVMAATASGLVTEITSVDEFRSKVLESKEPVLVDLWAPWCAPCRAQLPIVDQVATLAGDRAKVVKVNVDEVSEVAQNLRVGSIPTLLVYRDGLEIKRFVGVQPVNVLVQALGL